MKFTRQLFFAFLLISQQAQAQAPVQHQDRAALRAAVEQFLRLQSAGLPGQVTVTVGAIDPRLNLAACAAPQLFLSPGARAWGNTTVGVRCTAPAAWSIYIQAKVAVLADYVASAVPLAQGQPIQASQLLTMKGDITALPPGIVTDMAQAVGRSLSVSLPSGMPLRLDGLRAERVVQQGQLVRVVSSGAGFRVSAEARAIGNASEGQVVQVRTLGGQQISGVARAGGLVEVAY
ncbi:MAG: flagellar basal body P-ring formation protein FlgA [Burkholderiaceae bacterium]|nr:flagellar basal body P-ring formation protein FlgA [Burkholderiaceae bacterium]